MDERVMQFRVGVTFLAILIITGILLVMFGKLPSMIPGRYYTVNVLFDYAGGVSKDTPIRKSGILIGRVEDVQLTAKDAKVLLVAKIEANKSIYENEDCYITRDLLGDTALVFIPNPNKSGAGQPVKPGTTLHGMFSDDPTGLKRALADPIDTVSNTGRALTAASDQLSKAAKRVEDILDPDTQKNAQDLLRDMAASMATIRDMLGDEKNREQLSQAVQKLPDTLESMNHTFKATEEALSRFTERSPEDGRSAIERMVETIEMTERTLKRFSEPSRPGDPAPADQIARAMENIGEITTLMRTIMARIERGEGSLGALLNDRQLYDRVNRAARNIEEVSLRLKPIVEDARVLMDKGARHPGVFLRDAVKPGAGIK